MTQNQNEKHLNTVLYEFVRVAGSRLTEADKKYMQRLLDAQRAHEQGKASAVQKRLLARVAKHLPAWPGK